MSGRRGQSISEDSVASLVEMLEEQATSARQALNTIHALEPIKKVHALRRIRRIASLGFPAINVLRIVARHGAKGAIERTRSEGVPPSQSTHELVTHLEWVAKNPYKKNPKTGAERAKLRATAEDLLDDIASQVASGSPIDAEAMEYAVAVMVAIHSANARSAGSRGDAFIRAAGLDGHKKKYLRVSESVALAKVFGLSEAAAIQEAISQGLLPEDTDPEALRVELQRQKRKAQ